MKNKAVFLDRDGTINVDHGYVYKIEDFEFLPGAIDALRILQDKGYLLIIITNQSGIARGYYTEDDYDMLTKYMLNELKKEGINIADVFHCPHLPDAKVEKYRVDCDCRKPKLGLFEQAVRKWNIDLAQSYAVGDKARDCVICDSTPCKGFVIGKADAEAMRKAAQVGTIGNTCWVENLKTAALEIK